MTIVITFDNGTVLQVGPSHPLYTAYCCVAYFWLAFPV